jgi:predicted nucleic acid-binding protein
VIVADTGAIIALIDADDRRDRPLRTLFESKPDAWVLPWASLPEMDYLLALTSDGVSCRRAARLTNTLH